MDVEAYKKIIAIPKQSTEKMFAEYSDLIKWPEEEVAVIDVGCGEGSTTVTLLQDLIAKNVKRYKIVAVDLSEEAISSAKRNFSQENHIEFKQMDIGAEHLWSSSFNEHFDIAFSILCLHWIPNTNWIKNIYTMLKSNGQIFLFVATGSQVSDIFESVAKTDKWLKYQQSKKLFAFPFLNSGELSVWLTPLLEKVGFKNVVYKEFSYEIHIPNKNTLYLMLKTFPSVYEDIPSDKVKSFMDEIVEGIWKRYNKPTEFYLPSNFVVIIADK